MIEIFEAPYGGWKKCLFIKNALVELVVTLEVGPRIIRYALKDKSNVFCEKSEDIGLTGGEEWRIYGGHRLWHSPEAMPRSYCPDNFPVTWAKNGDTVTFTPPPEEFSRTQKQITITLSEDSSKVEVVHSITNIGAWDAKLSAWALTVLTHGGLEVLPEPDNFQALLPNRSLVLWPYTKMNDARLHWGEKYISIWQDKNAKSPIKIGLSNQSGWAAYFVDACLFIKHYKVFEKEEYPDFGASFETYTNDFMLECETLSPLRTLAPNETIFHTEEWALYPCKNMPSHKDEQAIEKALKIAFS